MASITGDDEFHFLNEVGSLDADGWDGEHKTKLWRYNLHYFDDLNAEEAVTRRTWHDALIARWIAENPPATGSGWEPYPTSLRIVNWVKTALHGHPLSDATQHSLAVQARWLTKRLEWHLLGNHLFANAKALMFVGFFFDGPEADGWRAQAATILERELTEQFLADGGQFELTPMYHALALEDVLDLVNLWAAFEGGLNARETALAKRCAAMVTEMTAWLSAMSHPDGKVSFFNDTAFKIAPENTELFEYADRLGFPISASTNSLTHLSASGYVRAESGPAVLIADVARVGPDYLPGHAHADTLSFEFSAFDQRVFINSRPRTNSLQALRLCCARLFPADAAAP
ncbi:MAG: heparinase II/III family protein, partial [Pseudomonadota bacterium]